MISRTSRGQNFRRPEIQGAGQKVKADALANANVTMLMPKFWYRGDEAKIWATTPRPEG